MAWDFKPFFFWWFSFLWPHLCPLLSYKIFYLVFFIDFLACRHLKIRGIVFSWFACFVCFNAEYSDHLYLQLRKLFFIHLCNYKWVSLKFHFLFKIIYIFSSHISQPFHSFPSCLSSQSLPLPPLSSRSNSISLQKRTKLPGISTEHGIAS